MLKTRVLSAVVGVPLILLLLVVRGYYLFAFVALLAFIGLYEYMKAMNAVKIETSNFLAYAATACYFVLLLIPGGLRYVGLCLALFIILLLSEGLIFLKHNIIGIAVTAFGVLYIPYLLSHLLYINDLKYGNIIIWLPILSAWFTDTCAYFIGISMGKKKLCPKVSPNKTIAGALGGVIGCIVLSLITGYIMSRLGHNLPLIHFSIVGLFCGIASELGDLSASYIKRYSGVKDFGNLIPGHGGVLDRFDSIIFTAPVVYYYFWLIQNIIQ